MYSSTTDTELRKRAAAPESFNEHQFIVQPQIENKTKKLSHILQAVPYKLGK